MRVYKTGCFIVKDELGPLRMRAYKTGCFIVKDELGTSRMEF